MIDSSYDDSSFLARCSKCGEQFPYTEEFFYSLGKGRCLQSRCKKCRNAADRAYQREHREELRAYAKEYNQRPEVIARQKARYKEWYNSPEGRHSAQVRSAKREARKKHIPGTFTPAQISDLLTRQKRRCYYCSTPFEKRNGKYLYHIDHTFPLSRVEGTDIPANDISYLVLACPFCNLSKHDKFPWEFPEGGKLL